MRRPVCRSRHTDECPVLAMRPIHQPVYQGAKNLWGELFEYCSDDASVFSRYKRRCYFQNSDLFGAQRMLLRRIPICHLIAAAIASADRFYWVREHELVQIIWAPIFEILFRASTINHPTYTWCISFKKSILRSEVRILLWPP